MNDPTTRWLEAMRASRTAHGGPAPVPLLQLKVKVCECDNPAFITEDGERRCFWCGGYEVTPDPEDWGPPSRLGT